MEEFIIITILFILSLAVYGALRVIEALIQSVFSSDYNHEDDTVMLIAIIFLLFLHCVIMGTIYNFCVYSDKHIFVDKEPEIEVIEKNE